MFYTIFHSVRQLLIASYYLLECVKQHFIALISAATLQWKILESVFIFGEIHKRK